MEKDKIRSAILTDFILSVEIVIIALGTVVEENIWTQIIVVSIIALVATIGVYGIVALIVRMDEFGARLIAMNDNENSVSDTIGKFLVRALPWVIKSLSVIGTIALILVAGGIFVHNLDFLHDLLHSIPVILSELLVGLVIGFICFLIVTLFKKIWRGLKQSGQH
jgi:predicted DNA repair protein MutK